MQGRRADVRVRIFRGDAITSFGGLRVLGKGARAYGGLSRNDRLPVLEFIVVVLVGIVDVVRHRVLRPRDDVSGETPIQKCQICQNDTVSSPRSYPRSRACVRMLSNLKVPTDVPVERAEWRPWDTASQEGFACPGIFGSFPSPSSRETPMPRTEINTKKIRWITTRMGTVDYFSSYLVHLTLTRVVRNQLRRLRRDDARRVDVRDALPVLSLAEESEVRCRRVDDLFIYLSFPRRDGEALA